jgi:hypothetical protein
MGCCVSKKGAKFPKDGLHLYSKEGRLLYTLIYANNEEYLLMNSISHDIVKLRCIDNICMGHEYIVIDGWVNPGWWISACWFFMFDETHKRLMNNNFIVHAHYLRFELSAMSLTHRHRKMGIKYLISIGTYDKDNVFTTFTEVMYGM